MRVRFFAPESEVEAALYMATLSQVDEFWRQFLLVAKQPPRHWLADLRSILARVHSELGLETAESEDGVRTLYILPLESGAAQALAELCVERAPAVPPWLFETERPACSLSQALAVVKADFGLDLHTSRARVGVTRGHLLEVVLACHEFTSSEDARGHDAAETLVQRLIGDRAFEDWIARISIQSAPRPNALQVLGAGAVQLLPLSLAELDAAILAAERGVLAGLTDAPYHSFCERAEWSLFELDEELRVSDGAQPRSLGGLSSRATSSEANSATSPFYSTPPQADLLLATTLCPEVLKCFLKGQPFTSRRFSRHGERFCYLKLRFPELDEESRYRRRAELEDQLNRALVPGRLGCVVGAGQGSEFVYVNLALTQIEPAVEVLRRRLQRFGVSNEVWLLFCDDEWREEWVALGNEPCPPLSR